MNTNKGSISCLLYYHFWHGTHGMIIILVLLQYVRQCVEQGGKINEYSNDGMTPLAVAAFWGYADIAEFLLEIE
jgi:ankyrin repeat protein